MILCTGLSVFLLLTFVYILEHVQNCLWLNIAQTARLRFIDIKEAGRRGWLAGHLCLLPADNDVTEVGHVSAMAVVCQTGCCSKPQWQGTDTCQHSLFSIVQYGKSSSKGVYVGDALLPLELGVLKTSHGSWVEDHYFSLGGRGLHTSEERDQAFWNMLIGLWPARVLSRDPIKKDTYPLKDNGVIWKARRFNMEGWKVNTI